MTVHGKALAMQLAMLKYKHAPQQPRYIPLIAPTKGNLLVTGIAAATTRDLQNTKFAPFAFGMLSAANTRLLLKHDQNIIAGKILALTYTANGEVAIQAELTNDYAKRCGGFSVAATVRDYIIDETTGVATITSAVLDEVTVTDCPANQQCLIKHRWPQSAAVAHYDIALQWVTTFKRLAEVIAHQAVQAQRQPKREVHSPPMAHRRPTEFQTLVQQMQEAPT